MIVIVVGQESNDDGDDHDRLKNYNETPKRLKKRTEPREVRKKYFLSHCTVLKFTWAGLNCRSGFLETSEKPFGRINIMPVVTCNQ